MKSTQDNETTPRLFELTPPNNVLDFSGTLQALRSNVDPELIRHRAGRRDRNGTIQMVEYVEWHTVADILDRYAPDWAHTIKDIRAIGDIVTVTVAITVNGVTREGIGTGKTASETGIKKAEHDALKRAAVKFGIARELYKREFDAVEAETREPREQRLPADETISKTLGDMVSARQLGMIRAIGRESGIDVDAECSRMMNCEIAELSKRAASDLIEHLKGLQRSASTPPVRRAG